MATNNHEIKSILIMTVSAEGQITYCRKERKRISAAAKNLFNNKQLFKTHGVI